MPSSYRRSRRYTRRNPRRYRRTYKRYSRRTRFRRNDNKVYNFRQRYVAEVVAGTITEQIKVYTPYAALIPQWTSFTALYDQYRINRVRCEITSENNDNNTVTTGVQPVSSVIDYDGQASAPTYLQMQEYGTFKETPFPRDHIRTFVPRILREIYQDALTTGYETAKPTWLDCNNGTIPHFGMYVRYPVAASTAQAWHVRFTLDISFRNVK